MVKKDQNWLYLKNLHYSELRNLPIYQFSSPVKSANISSIETFIVTNKKQSEKMKVFQTAKSTEMKMLLT